MGWYVGSGDGLTISVIGWHTGVLGKLVFFIGLAVLALVALRQAGIEPPATVPESLIVIALGALATVFVLIRADLDPGAVPARGRPRDRHLDQPGRGDRRDRRRASRSSRRAVATPSPSSGPGDHVERVVHADIHARVRDRRRPGRRARSAPRRDTNCASVAAHAKLVAAWPDGNEGVVERPHERIGRSAGACRSPA